MLVLGLLSPWRRQVAAAYLVVVAGGLLAETGRDGDAAPAYAIALPVMHLTWGLGFFAGLLRSPQHTPTYAVEADEGAIGERLPSHR